MGRTEGKGNNARYRAKEYASKTLCDPDDGPSTGLAKESFIAGAEWKKEQMMKEVIDGTVHHVKAVHYIITNQDQLTKRLKQFEEGDKVKIVIIRDND